MTVTSQIPLLSQGYSIVIIIFYTQH